LRASLAMLARCCCATDVDMLRAQMVRGHEPEICMRAF